MLVKYITYQIHIRFQFEYGHRTGNKQREIEHQMIPCVYTKMDSIGKETNYVFHSWNSLADVREGRSGVCASCDCIHMA